MEGTPTPFSTDSGPVSMSDSASGGVVEFEGFTVRSNESSEEIKESLAPDSDSAVTKAAKELGKASAEKRKIAPIPPKKAKPVEKVEEADEPLPENLEAAAEDEKPEEQPKKGNPRHDPTARVAQATREAREAREEAARARAELEQERRLRLQPPADPNKKPEPEFDWKTKPQAKDYEDYDKYLDDRDDWNRAQWAQEQHETRQREEKVQRYAKTFETTVGGYQTRMREEFPDGDHGEAVDAILSELTPSILQAPGEQVQPSARTDMGDYIVRSKNVGKILRYFAENPEDFQRIASAATQAEVIGEMAIIEHRVSAASTATAPRGTTTKAPAPFRPVKGMPHNAPVEEDLENASFETFARTENAKQRAQR